MDTGNAEVCLMTPTSLILNHLHSPMPFRLKLWGSISLDLIKYYESIIGIIITAKQRQEFRIRLQKRARKKAEQRIDAMIEEKHSHIVRTTGP